MQKEIAALHELVGSTDKHLKKAQTSLKLVEEDLDQLDEKFMEGQAIVENLDDVSRKNNICLRGFREAIEGANLHTSLKDLFLECLKTESDVAVSIE